MLTRESLLKILDSFDEIKNVLVLGDVGIDKYTSGVVERISPEAPVPVVKVDKEWFKLGLASNVCDNLNELKISTSLSGVIGQDDYNSTFKSLLKEKSLNSDLILESSSKKTILKERIVAKNQQVCRIDYEDNTLVSEAEVNQIFDKLSSIPIPDGIIVEDYGKGFVTSSLIEKLKNNFPNTFIAVDPSITKHPSIYKNADLLKPNLSEAISMSKILDVDTDNYEEMAKGLLEKLNLNHIVITLGAEGMLSLSRDGISEVIATMAQQVFDVSGAGDTSISLLTACLIGNASLSEASQVANLGAGVVVSKPGTATITREEILSFFDRVYA